MRKLKLDVESLNVQTFETDDDEAVARGTIEGRDLTGDTTGPWICDYECPCNSRQSPPWSC
jgi:hypothetical protein